VLLAVLVAVLVVPHFSALPEIEAIFFADSGIPEAALRD
jgi:hypothetical protein